MRTRGACAIAGLNFDLLVASNGVLFDGAASQNRRSCQFADKHAEKGYYDKSDVVLSVK